MTTRTKLVCTLGPATNTPKFIRGLVTAGASIFRINFSHGSSADHERAVELVRAVEAKSDGAIAVMADLPGPKVRLGTLHRDPLKLVPGQGFALRHDAEADEESAATTYPDLARDMRTGDRILLADGAVELAVTGVDGHAVQTECVRGGTVRSGQGVNVPAERLSLPAITERDREGLARALDLGVDLVAQSFVRGPQDIKELRALMGTRSVPIVAKIETKPAVEQIDKILRVTDVVMVARGDLGVELPMEEIPLLQKDLLRAARAASTPAIVATQMLESMIRAPRPTRAEATDVANAVLDGADGIMLSGETAIGRFPFEAAAAAARIAAAVESRGEEYRAAQPACRHAGEGPRGGPRRRRGRDRGSQRRGHHVLHGDRSYGPTALGRASELPRLCVHPRRRCPPCECRAVGSDAAARPEAGRHRRDDRVDGRGTSGVRARGTGRRCRHGGRVTRRQDHHEHAEDPSRRISPSASLRRTSGCSASSRSRRPAR